MGSMNRDGYGCMENPMQGLWLHLTTNFYPPHPPEYVEHAIETMRKHREEGYLVGEHEKLADEMYVTSVDALFKYFGLWIVQEDV